ncbi:MAG: CDP-diacylglycerol--glycerol-3-phosphate 3-phosphatidyltransferase [Candidatus Woesearchaeota archaeon]|jgi:CDP-diacylglycerol--glycerol-3-phosphate 3-phosphatidyltransferase|nr:CDP-diacylglycerol--glycerol-3-phosphate 3-phosphatidyltransferase [Candidatus Woesearchaeota archaeon]MDP7506375.1 CDP-diacylglycerol--glycerol-3-phosphate 3-phosphatidyltransferase [Candidatus Woesearchaeota archaeon]MDP7610775.1 CDP-diacylglycerol--glycerol-3-phosphate 3-phosphatidyltransferase [Candidatus Woesearchaeota archaeon]|tara:strand:- start:289 stop:792 length:504 start_codon:yes stop_codon:yes gene_type:complete
MNLANKITLLRILLIPVFVLFLVWNVKYIAAVMFLLIALTDALDGYIARKRKEVTELGKLIDPLADKLLVSAALIFLIGKGIPAWMVFLIIAREFAVTGLRVLAASKHGGIIHASKLGKAKTISQFVGIIAVIIGLRYSWIMMLAATLFTVVSGIDYFIKNRKVFRI